MKQIKLKCPCCDEEIIIVINNDKVEISQSQQMELSEQELSEKFGIELG